MLTTASDRKVLSGIDSFYREAISKLSKVEKLTYCENLIDKTQSVLLKNKCRLSNDKQQALTDLLTAAQYEIYKLMNNP